MDGGGGVDIVIVSDDDTVQINKRRHRDCNVSGQVLNSEVDCDGKQRKVHQLPNMRCRPDRFFELITLLDKRQCEWVSEMGFGELLKISAGKVNRYLCLWLMNRFDPDKRRLLVRDNHYVDISANDVGWVMGIPGPNSPVPKDISPKVLFHLKRKYGNNNGMDERAVFGAVVRSMSEVEFKHTFLLYTLGVLLCPTQSCRISPMHLKVLHVATDAYKYNWCRYVFEWLVKCARSFSVSKNKYGGCAVFLMVFYLDRINIGNPVNWSTTSSRVDAWDREMLRHVIHEDSKNLWEFGRAEFVPDVIYGAPYPIGNAKVRWEEIRAKAIGLVGSALDEGEEEVQGR